uniref:Uncharacterized protein n=1 Tax=Mycolicibacterium sp. CBMA 213 TaxID=1968788 RepID=A0A343VQZ9_9MYCO|nr:hypothetical protein [Mycolicibacterium sp. CBMA 213]AVN58323.1 hypothetical protein B5P44_p00028 [Mycolicibacterium sp. CBMA 213]
MTDDVVPTTVEHTGPDIDGVALVLETTKGLNPDVAWHHAVSGNTAARMAGTAHDCEYAGTAELLRRAAAYGWWPMRTRDGDYIAVPLKAMGCRGPPIHTESS